MMKYYQHQNLQHFHYLNSTYFFHQMLLLFNLTVPNKHFFKVKLLVGLRGKLFNSKSMYKFKLKLLYNEEELFALKKSC